MNKRFSNEDKVLFDNFFSFIYFLKIIFHREINGYTNFSLEI